MKQENQRIRLTKRLLQEALLELLENKDLNAIEVSELCRTAGINRTTFYNHYNNVGDLFEELESEFIGGIRKSMPKECALTLAGRVEKAAEYLLCNEYSLQK